MINIFASRFVIAILLFFPILALGDDYPVNKKIDVQHYVFSINLSDSTDIIYGEAQITILFKQNGIRNFRLDFADSTPERGKKGMIIEKLSLQDRDLNFTHQNDVLTIELPNPSVAGSVLTFRIKYHGIPHDALRIGSTRFGDRSFFNENWPNRARNWLPTYDHPSNKATSEFIVQAPSHYKVISNGLLLEESDLGNNFKLTHWKQSVPVSSWLFVLGVADFAVQYVDRFNGKSIESWVYAKNREQGFYDFYEPTKKVLEFFTNYVGPFAYEKLANIQSPSVSGGMETSSAIFYAENLINGKRDERTRNVVIHEIAHQWFGNAVTETSWDDVWLSEGFATYFTLLFIENEYGSAEFQKGIQKAKKTIFDLSLKLPDHSVVGPRTAEKEQVTTGLTYQKGAWVLHMLRNLMGDEKFKKGIRSYYSKYFNSNATTTDFRIEMEKAAGINLEKFFNQWLYQPIHPIINTSWIYNNKTHKLIIEIDQIQKGDIVFNIPIEIGYNNNGLGKSKILKFQLNQRNKKIEFPLDVKPDRVEFDPRNILLCEVNISEKK
ncbi:MAG: M1 family metallopeptidase [Chitinophagaceae bacterium]